MDGWMMMMLVVGRYFDYDQCMWMSLCSHHLARLCFSFLSIAPDLASFRFVLFHSTATTVMAVISYR